MRSTMPGERLMTGTGSDRERRTEYAAPDGPDSARACSPNTSPIIKAIVNDTGAFTC